VALLSSNYNHISRDAAIVALRCHRYCAQAISITLHRMLLSWHCPQAFTITLHGVPPSGNLITRLLPLWHCAAIVALRSGDCNYITQNAASAIVALPLRQLRSHCTGCCLRGIAPRQFNHITGCYPRGNTLRQLPSHHTGCCHRGIAHHITRDVQTHGSYPHTVTPRSSTYLPSHTHYHDNTEPKIVALALPPAESSIISVGRFALCSPERKKRQRRGARGHRRGCYGHVRTFLAQQNEGLIREEGTPRGVATGARPPALLNPVTHVGFTFPVMNPVVTKLVIF